MYVVQGILSVLTTQANAGCRPDMKIYLVRQDRDDDVMPYDVSTETTVGDLKSIIAAETDATPNTFTLIHNDSPLLDDSKHLGAVGVSDGDMLSLVPQPTSSTSREPSQRTDSASAAPVETQVEELRQRLIASPEMQATYRERMPQLLTTMHDPRAFRETVVSLETQRRAAQDQHFSQLAALNDDVNEENQAKILEMIRQEQIDKEMETAMQTNPELFGRVTMLYVDVLVNGVPVKAFVDSGAQATIMSPDCAERCNVTRLIDRRWQGMARGVGTAKILGRVHRATLRIADDEVPCAFTVMEGKDVDMLLGLDMLKRYQACIDLAANRLVFPGGQSVPFLPESEIPKNFDEAAAAEPTVAGPGGTTIGAQSGALKAPSGAVAVGTSSPAKAGASNFSGQGKTLGSAAAASSSASSAAAPSSSTGQASTRPAPPATRPAAAASAAAGFPQADIDALTGMGISREQAIQLLQACNGNVEMAAATAFEML